MERYFNLQPIAVFGPVAPDDWMLDGVCVSYLVADVDLQQDVAVAVAVVELQHQDVPRGVRAVVDVLDLLPAQLLQLEAAEAAVAVETAQPAVSRWLQDHDQDVGRVVGVVHLQHRPGDGGGGTAALDLQRGESQHPGGLDRREGGCLSTV